MLWRYPLDAWQHCRELIAFNNKPNFAYRSVSYSLAPGNADIWLSWVNSGSTQGRKQPINRMGLASNLFYFLDILRLRDNFKLSSTFSATYAES